MGGHDNVNLQNDGNTTSIYTSWTTSKQIASQWATVHGSGGVVLEKEFYPNDMIFSPDFWEESEVLIIGIDSGAKVNTPGAVGLNKF